jgi:hypothetical protein
MVKVPSLMNNVGTVRTTTGQNKRETDAYNVCSVVVVVVWVRRMIQRLSLLKEAVKALLLDVKLF